MQPQSWQVAVSVGVIFLGSKLLGSYSYFSFSVFRMLVVIFVLFLMYIKLVITWPH